MKLKIWSYTTTWKQESRLYHDPGHWEEHGVERFQRLVTVRHTTFALCRQTSKHIRCVGTRKNTLKPICSSRQVCQASSTTSWSYKSAIPVLTINTYEHSHSHTHTIPCTYTHTVVLTHLNAYMSSRIPISPHTHSLLSQIHTHTHTQSSLTHTYKHSLLSLIHTHTHHRHE